jgi:hypothetical protein
VFSGQTGTCGSHNADGRPAEQYEQGDHGDRSKCPPCSRLGPFRTSGIGQCNSRAAVANSHPATRSPTPHSANWPRWHPGPAPVAIDRSGPRSRISTSAVTVQVAKRSARDLIPQPRAALGWPPRLGPLALSGLPGWPTGEDGHRRGRLRTKASLSGRERGLGSGPTRRELGLPTFVDQNTGACRSPRNVRPVQAGLLGHCQPDGVLTEHPG